MIRGKTWFRCPGCGTQFEALDIEDRATILSMPMPCPKCGTMSPAVGLAGWLGSIVDRIRRSCHLLSAVLAAGVLSVTSCGSNNPPQPAVIHEDRCSDDAEYEFTDGGWLGKNRIRVVGVDDGFLIDGLQRVYDEFD